MTGPEAQFQARIVAAAKQFGWKVWHVPTPMRWSRAERKFVPAKEGGGLPDLILMHDDPPRLVFLELKREGGKLSDKQREFLQAAKRVAGDAWASAEVDGLEFQGMGDRVIGVVAAWPDDEERIIQMLRSKAVA